MSITATFYTYSKRENSTAVPTGGTAVAVNLKADTSLLTPTLLLQWGSRPGWSMFLFEGRYYFVTNISSPRNGQWEVSGRVDVLATYKAQIGSTAAYIVYANGGNVEIIDTRLPIKTTPVVDYRNANVPGLSQSGAYLLTVVGASDTAGGTQGARTYALSAGALGNVLGSVRQYISDIGAQDTSSMEAILSIGRQLVGAGAVTENIRGCTWVPWDVVSMGDVTNEKIWLGLFDCSTGRVVDVAGYAIDVPVKSVTLSVTIPWQAADWRRNSPYHQVYLYIPFVGLVPVSSENLAAASALDLVIAVNRLTGNINVQVKAGGELIGTYSAATGIGIPVGAAGAPAELAAVGALAQGASLVAGMAHAEAGNILGTMAAASHIAPNTICAGNLSGGAGIGLDQVVSCYTVFHDVSDDPANLGPVIGVPYNLVAAISSISGFVQTAQASVAIAGTDQERQQINTLLNGGIFYE